ncbi:nucleotidyl transferase AbiEii/AbiGii toxin family protein [Flavobacterium alkalisoli]|uniref:Nucleotidyl transferase AbiEii/AbiGii toxin family protein n=1 Tax=Flavobacterium alkalisoli TaxID=2602769 RepID=A0A5B9FVV4_9FLAO|nr:nucleotidyl transferase AbiEii/AbiGii toxin family protein [Flavobacterium alkalisoli]QEE49888.1 nucleotidyl transferase AbiEii/AbiGii toxin family protein [Flavobacterium alkalisoli]
MIHWNTVSESLREALLLLMQADALKEFRLVGGTALSLQLGHRISVDIDLFTDADYGSVDFGAIESFLELAFPYLDKGFGTAIGMGKSYLIGRDKENAVKLDLYYTDPFITPPFKIEDLRMATAEEIIAMKMDIVQRGGRKKDFWDLHELLASHAVSQMIALHEKRYPYTHDRQRIVANFTDFRLADDDFDPVSLKGYYWELIKEDLEQALGDMT